MGALIRDGWCACCCSSDSFSILHHTSLHTRRSEPQWSNSQETVRDYGPYNAKAKRLYMYVGDCSLSRSLSRNSKSNVSVERGVGSERFQKLKDRCGAAVGTQSHHHKPIGHIYYQVKVVFNPNLTLPNRDYKRLLLHHSGKSPLREKVRASDMRRRMH